MLNHRKVRGRREGWWGRTRVCNRWMRRDKAWWAVFTASFWLRTQLSVWPRTTHKAMCSISWGAKLQFYRQEQVRRIMPFLPSFPLLQLSLIYITIYYRLNMCQKICYHFTCINTFNIHKICSWHILERQCETWVNNLSKNRELVSGRSKHHIQTA